MNRLRTLPQNPAARSPKILQGNEWSRNPYRSLRIHAKRSGLPCERRWAIDTGERSHVETILANRSPAKVPSMGSIYRQENENILEREDTNARHEESGYPAAGSHAHWRSSARLSSAATDNRMRPTRGCTSLQPAPA